MIVFDDSGEIDLRLTLWSIKKVFENFILYSIFLLMIFYLVGLPLDQLCHLNVPTSILRRLGKFLVFTLFEDKQRLKHGGI